MAVRAHKLGPGRLTIGEAGSAAEFGASCKSMSVTPEIEDGDRIPVVSGETVDGAGKISITLEATLLQQYDRDSLLVFAAVNNGKELPFEMIPDNGRELMVTGKVTVRPLKIGGNAQEINESDIAWKGNGMYEIRSAKDKSLITTWTPLDPVPGRPDGQPVDWD